MLAAGQYGAMSFAAYPAPDGPLLGTMSHCMPLQRRRYPPDKAVFFTGLRAGLFLRHHAQDKSTLYCLV
ncbi:hypothetical protein AGR13a_Cc220016 [Agrobacterium genomosp. 13 str. CFBP 6927]|uniref:Uncharacterized protein n=1 Tax=Agrobacterium genomosp. 13 str. CFBP 6927 TaxID=1183428 RepID=A0ABP2BHY0_9HYPH|nr:hypothetical protein AGR13a_Cc220016 [Agrobacterium genomosp. 13 str. CFBP 6927]